MGRQAKIITHFPTFCSKFKELSACLYVDENNPKITPNFSRWFCNYQTTKTFNFTSISTSWRKNEK